MTLSSPKSSASMPRTRLPTFRDLSGVRVICLVLSQLRGIDRLIKDTFQLVSEEYQLDPTLGNEGGYPSVHYVVRLPMAYEWPRCNDIRDLVCEIQVRTVFMDAWTNVCHALSCKQPTDVPRALRRDFDALSGLFYIADTHFEMLFKAATNSRDQIDRDVREKNPFLDRELDVDSLTALLRVLYPGRWTRDCDADVDDLLQELSWAGYRTVGELKAVLDAGRDDFLEYERLYPPQTETLQFNSCGVVRMILQALDDNYVEVRRRRGLAVTSIRPMFEAIRAARQTKGQ